MKAVPEFGLALLKPQGAPSGKIETFIEVPLKVGDKAVRPDGVISVSRGAKTWGAILEVKTGSNPMLADQINLYLDLARELEFDAVLSISNQFSTAAREYPVDIDRRKLKKTSLKHWSWVDVLTEAIVQKEFRGVSDPDQAYMLGELIRYLSDPRSGAVAFEGMGPSWTAVRDGARNGTLRKPDPALTAVAARWDDLVRYVALSLTSDLGREVRQVLAVSERKPSDRREALVDSLATGGVLYAELRIPDVAGLLHLQADLRSRQVSASTTLDAPKEGTAKGRVSWLLRQLQKAPDVAVVESRIGRRGQSPAAPLRVARDDPSSLYPERGDIRAFRVSLTTNMGLKRDDGRGSFVRSVLDTVEGFYVDVLQNVRAWKAPPPKLKRTAEEEKVVQTVADLVGVEPTDVAAEVIQDVADADSSPDYVETVPAPAPELDAKASSADSPSDGTPT